MLKMNKIISTLLISGVVAGFSSSAMALDGGALYADPTRVVVLPVMVKMPRPPLCLCILN